MKEESKKKKSYAKHSSNRSESCITSTSTLLCFLLIVAHFIASFFPQGRIWGINQWAYFPFYVTFPVTLPALFFLFPPFNHFVRNSLKTLTSPLLEWMGKKKHLWYLIFSLLSFILFWTLRTKTHFLGDGYQILSNVESDQLAFKFTEPLESLLHFKAFHLAKGFFNLNSETLYALLSCLAGSIFVYLIFLFADFLGKERSQKILVFLILISMATIQLFFGYVEHYTFLFLSIFGFLFLSLAYLEEKGKLIFPILTFILAFLFHISVLYLLPSVFFLSIAKNVKNESYPSNSEIKQKSPHERVLKDGSADKTKKILLAILGLFLVAVIFLGYQRYGWSIPPLFVPFTNDRYSAPGYTLFSLPHLSDFLNQQLLVSPVGLILILVILICRKGKSFFSSSTSQFLLIVALSQLLFNFIIDPGLGASRDWDMFSAVGLGYTILALYLLFNLMKEKTKLGYLTTMLVVTSLYSTIPWIALNSSQPKAIERFRNLLLIDPKKSQNGHFILAKYFKFRGQEEEIEKQNHVQRELLPELPLLADGKKFLAEGKFDSAEVKLLWAKKIAPGLAQIYDNLGMVYFAKGNLKKAETEYRRAIELGSFLSGPYFNLGNLYLVKREMDSALEYYKKAVFLKCQFPDLYYNLGHIYFLKGNPDKAEGFFKKALTLKSDLVDAYVGLGNIYKERREFPKAIKMYQTAIQIKPDLAEAHLWLGMTYLYTSSKDEAIKELEKFLELALPSENVEQVRKILTEIRP